MASSLVRYGLRTISAILERQAAIPVPICTHFQKNQQCTNNVNTSGAPLPGVALFQRRCYSKQIGPARAQADSDSDTESGIESGTRDRSMFWRRKMRTVHHILDVDKDGLISYDDYLLLAERFKALGHLDERQAQEFTQIIKSWEQQWGVVDRYNLVTVEQYLEDMQHRTRRTRPHQWLPYLFKAVDADKSGYISVKEFQLFYTCLGLSREHAAIAFAVIDTNSDGKLSQREFVSLGEEFFTSDDESCVSNMFWGPLIQ